EGTPGRHGPRLASTGLARQPHGTARPGRTTLAAAESTSASEIEEASTAARSGASCAIPAPRCELWYARSRRRRSFKELTPDALPSPAADRRRPRPAQLLGAATTAALVSAARCGAQGRRGSRSRRGCHLGLRQSRSAPPRRRRTAVAVFWSRRPSPLHTPCPP